jgi:hypothetical protein
LPKVDSRRSRNLKKHVSTKESESILQRENNLSYREAPKHQNQTCFRHILPTFKNSITAFSFKLLQKPKERKSL